MNYNLIESLCSINGVSGFESDVTDYIENIISGHVQSIEYDACGNLIAFKKGKKGSSGKKILYSCHVDEVGFVIKHINDDGTLLFDSIGIITESYCGKKVLVGKNKIVGIISTKPFHLLSDSEKEKPLTCDELLVDIGAKSKEEAEKLGVYADFAVLSSIFEEFGENKIKSKALDDRIGCAMLIELILRGVEYDSYFSFCTLEESGLRGSKVVASRICPDICINLECTTAGDICSVEGSKKVCCLDGGVVVPFMDNSAVYTKKLYKKITDIAAKNKIKYQTKTEIAGGTDAGAYIVTAGGRKIAGLAVPTRYIHTAVSVASKADIDSTLQLLFAVSDNIKELIDCEEE